MRVVGQPIRKKDAMALVTGKPVYTDDMAPKDCLVVKVLRSPHANALVQGVKKEIAEKVPGIEAIYTWEDVPQERFTMAGQTYPEPSPYDRLILDQHVRYVGDPVAIVAGENEACVDRVPCAPDSVQCTWNLEIEDSGVQAENRWWFRSKTDGRVRGVPGVCYMEDRQSIQDDLHKRRITDCFLSET